MLCIVLFSCRCPHAAGGHGGEAAAAQAAGQPSQPLQGVLAGPSGGGGAKQALSTAGLREGSMEWKPSREVLQTFGASKRGSGDIT